MITLTKEWLLKTIAELEEERDAVPGIVNADAAMALEAMKRALASLRADPVAWTDEQELRDVEKYGCGYLFTAYPITPHADPRRVIKLYTIPPAPVVPDECPVEIRDLLASHSDALFHDGDAQEIWNACRAAMLQGAEPVKTAYKLPAIGWLRADYQDDNRGLRGNAPLFVLGKKDPSTVWGLDYIPLTSNSSVIPDGVCPCCGRKPLKNRTCSVSGCDGKHVARGFCIKHYAIERKKDPSRRESIRAADKHYRARKAAAPQQEVKKCT